MSQSEIRSVGPYLIEETLGRGQTGEPCRKFTEFITYVVPNFEDPQSKLFTITHLL